MALKEIDIGTNRHAEAWVKHMQDIGALTDTIMAALSPATVAGLNTQVLATVVKEPNTHLLRQATTAFNVAKGSGVLTDAMVSTAQGAGTVANLLANFTSADTLLPAGYNNSFAF